MADVFISYKREDRARIAPLARALEAHGYTVWWDLELVPSQKFERQIKQELDDAKCVIVVWTERLIGSDGMYLSDWVQTEANAGDSRGILLPVQFDPGRVHWRHGQNQYASLHNWTGDETAPGFRDLLKGVGLHAGARLRPEDRELAAWQTAERSETSEAFRAFLHSYPSSRFAEIARGRIDDLEEVAAWKRLGAAPDAAALDAFLRVFPAGRFAESAEAKRRAIWAVPTQADPKPSPSSRPSDQETPTHAPDASADATRRRLVWAAGAAGVGLASFTILRTLGKERSGTTQARPTGSDPSNTEALPDVAAEARRDAANGASSAPLPPKPTGIGAPQALLIWRKQKLRHRLGLNSISFSPDGTLCVTACGDDALYLWNAASGELVRKFEGHANDANSAAFSPDGNLLVSTSTDRTVRIWQVATGASVRVISGIGGRGGTATFSPDGRTIAAAAWDGRVRIWSLDGALQQTISIADIGFSARFSPDGARIVATGKQNAAVVFDARSGAAQFSLVGHESQLADAEFSPDGSRIATASTDGTARIWDASNGRLLLSVGEIAPSGAGRWVNQATFSGDGALLATAHRENVGADTGAIRIWEAATGRLITRFAQGPEMVSAVAFSRDTTRLASASWDGFGSIWAIEAG